ncbi:bifunctional 3-(3-hydroxy-phenyl)propionate/3-hydroxycinnamic acid hydroxylase [Bradyrhizobium manausense]|uniref:bifunctional 3-(3-hydroxy-phenyl)propionate/3-hydroxycinnamic acid hydroxylase n=1 Tax=Bradyrhizobium TaxID=374 RepID=UPI001BABE6F8|nr:MULTISPECIES: bifunctional 3-(3-hydroxy-phenyl)propionate/3-hydroxycinnamic acid hydroxylase [Bradyrhizobium]MBR0830012.1 bifunctional 3-(3-hydroxy-phenyl)propionate/3-hydroxycinnamic acid hydroxylase [Bradyrhizobium manausense]UVO27746.1 bifunctional 3-(3-hydroxy-phenyl)propionate/3-hydroxycinnamic acid hydroxylase [Bradyrhizobium arachidis]
MIPVDERDTSASSGNAPDVVVVGLGPVGITLCNLLAAEGVSVEGVDAATDVYGLPRAIGMDHEVMRIFQNVGAADALAPAVGDYRPSEYRSAQGVLLRRFESPAEPYPLAWPPYLTFLQPELEQVLRDNAKRFPTLTLRTGLESIELKDPHAPILTLRDRATGETTRRTPRFVVGCDGGNSFVRRSLDIGFEDLGFHEPWLVVDMIVEDEHAQLPQTNIQFCNPSRPHTFVIGPGRLRRWEFMILPDEDPDDVNRPARIWELLSPWLRPDQARLWRSATYTFHALVAETWRKGRVFLAGDACHMMPPFLAQGMVQGIKDAANLAWKLAHVLRGTPEGLLDTYQAERRALVRDVIEITKRLGRVICELDPEKARARDAELIAAMEAGQGIQIRQNLFPPIRHGVVAHRADGSLSPGVGEPSPQPWIVSPGGRTRLDDLLPSGFVLLLAEDIDAPPALLEQARKLGVTVHRISRTRPERTPLAEEDGVFAAWLSAKGACATLVRPDRMVFGTAANVREVEVLLRELRSHLAG